MNHLAAFILRLAFAAASTLGEEIDDPTDGPSWTVPAGTFALFNAADWYDRKTIPMPWP